MFLRNVGDTIKGKEISLVVEVLAPADVYRDYVPSYVFGILSNATKERVGRISLRIGSNELIDRYAGNIGYTITKKHRGNGFAEKACRLLATLAIEHDFEQLYITCSPDNGPSRRTIEKLGSTLLGVENVPRNTEMYERGERIKLRFLWKPEE
ncbi:MAG: GNAT family N-acetyltransferase [Rhodothermales bacterium]